MSLHLVSFCPDLIYFPFLGFFHSIATSKSRYKKFHSEKLTHGSKLSKVMLTRNPKPASRKWIKKGAISLFVIEGACFVISYGLWYKVNTSRDTRKYLHDNYPQLLELYYKTGETVSSNSQIREIDRAYWDANK